MSFEKEGALENKIQWKKNRVNIVFECQSEKPGMSMKIQFNIAYLRFLTTVNVCCFFVGREKKSHNAFYSKRITEENREICKKKKQHTHMQNKWRMKPAHSHRDTQRKTHTHTIQTSIYYHSV